MTASKTLHVKLTDTEIKRHVGTPSVRDLRDPRFPSLLFRYRRNRERGSWIVMRHADGKTQFKKAANYPEVSAKAMTAAVDGLTLQLLGTPPTGGLVDQVDSVGQVLDWYAERCARLRHLSDDRKSTIQTVISVHLKPALGALAVAALDRAVIDRRLVLPLQDQLALSYVRQILGVLQAAFTRALRSELIRNNPIAGLTFSQFIPAKIEGKGATLRPDQLPELLERWAGVWKEDPRRVGLAVLMLLHATRIGESRQAKWTHFNLSGRDPAWNIPASDTKTGAAHRLPLTPTAVAFLEVYRNHLKRRGVVSAWLFPGRDGKPMTKRDATRYIDELSAGEWPSHDLRKVARTTWADIGIDLWVAERLLNHAMKDLQAAYIHTHAEDRCRDALERWHARLTEDGPLFFAAFTRPLPPAEPINPQPSNDAA